MIEFKHEVIPTPIDTVNILCAGGLKLGTIAEFYGPQHSGKSATSYQIAGMLHQSDPTSEVVILDPEGSVDYVRLVMVFGLDPNRTVVEPCPTLEEGFAAISKYIATSREEMKKPKTAKKRLLIWDSIAASVPAADYNKFNSGSTDMFSGGISLRPRVITHFLGETMSSISGLPMVLILINQIRDKIGGWSPTGNLPPGRTGGRALEHAGHYRLFFTAKQKFYDESKGMNVGTNTHVNIEKNKFGATTKKIPIWIDDTVGGKIVPNEELVNVCLLVGVIRKSEKRGWYCFAREPEVSYRLNKTEEPNVVSQGRWLIKNPAVHDKCLEELTKFYRINFFTLDQTYKLANIKLGEYTDDDVRLYRGMQGIESEVLVQADGSVRIEGKYKSDELYAMSMPDLVALYNDLKVKNNIVDNFNEQPTKRDIINTLIKYELCDGVITDSKIIDNQSDNTTNEDAQTISEQGEGEKSEEPVITSDGYVS